MVDICVIHKVDCVIFFFLRRSLFPHASHGCRWSSRGFLRWAAVCYSSVPLFKERQEVEMWALIISTLA